MAAILWTDVLNLAPELSTVATGAQNIVLAWVNGSGLDVNSFDGEDGTTTQLARIYLAAHLASSVGHGASGVSGGPVTSESMGGMSRSYSVPSMPMKSAYSSTVYGRMYETLVDNSLARLPVVI